MTEPLKTELLQITADHFLKRINPDEDEEGWNYGDGYSYSEADTIELLQEKEETVVAMLPEVHRRLAYSTSYHGEILTRRYRTGQVLKIKLTPIVSGTLLVYVNYPQDQPWISSERENHALENSKYEFAAETGVVSIPTIRDDDRVYCTYDHEATKRALMLRRLALDLAVVQIARDIHLDSENYNVYQDIENNVYSTFKKMREKGDARISIPLFDNLPKVIPTRNTSSVVIY